MIETFLLRNIALIDELALELSPGLNIFTGETGAGKSVILKSVGLVLGERATADIVREGADVATVEVAVAPPQQPRVAAGYEDSEHRTTQGDAFENRYIELADEDSLILSRQINASGRSRGCINGRLATLKQLQALGTQLVDIHGQHEHQSLFKTETHLNLLDAFGGCGELRKQIHKLYEHRQRLQQEISELRRDLQTTAREKERLEFECAELEAATLEEGEEEKLIAEARRLTHAETLFESANQVYGCLDSGGHHTLSVMELLKSTTKTLTSLSDVDASLSTLNQQLESASYEIEDVALQIRRYADTVELNPIRLAEVNDRLEQLSKLKRRYGNSVSEILAYHAEASEQLQRLNLSTEKMASLDVEMDKVNQEAQQLCAALSAKRKQVAKRLSSLIEKELRMLSMDKARFRVSVVPKVDGTGPLLIDGQRYAFGADGMDSVEFLIAPNVGSTLRPIASIASGGEISRIMLALKTVLVQVDNIRTLIFDEIDSGIGGKVADVIGQKLKELSASSQVICITHLPQLARFADQHFRVEKKIVGHRTLITAKPLTEEERVYEIARMHGGEETEIGLAHAREMLSESTQPVVAGIRYSSLMAEKENRTPPSECAG